MTCDQQFKRFSSYPFRNILEIYETPSLLLLNNFLSLNRLQILPMHKDIQCIQMHRITWFFLSFKIEKIVQSTILIIFYYGPYTGITNATATQLTFIYILHTRRIIIIPHLHSTLKKNQEESYLYKLYRGLLCHIRKNPTPALRRQLFNLVIYTRLKDSK